MSNSHNDLYPSLDQVEKSLSVLQEQKKREEQFSLEANSRFKKNLVTFDKYYPEIAKEIRNFQSKEDFAIHVTSTGYGNFVPTGHNVPLYSDDPISQVEQQVSDNIASPVFSLTSYNHYYKADNDFRIHSIYMDKLSRCINDFDDSTYEKLSVLPDTFPSGIIFGIGLGYHLPILLSKCKFDNLFIVEPDFEQFFASLFCIDWYQIIETIDEQGGGLFIHLGVDKRYFMRDLEYVVESIGAFAIVRSFIYQHRPDLMLQKLISTWVYEYFRFQSGHGFYNDAITGLAHSIHHVKNQVPIYQENTDRVIGFDVPVFVIGNGPSLDEAEKFLIQNKDKAIFIVAGTAIASVRKKGLPIDFHVLVERPYANHRIFGEIYPEDEYKDINLLAVNMVYPETISRYKWAGIAVKGNEAGTNLMQVYSKATTGHLLPQIPFSNPLVSNTALSFALSLGFRNIYLFGVDNGKSPEGAHHSADSVYKKQNTDKCNGIYAPEISGKSLPGNLGGQVITNELYMMSNAQLEKLIEHFNNVEVFNVGRGAKINGAIGCHVEELFPLDRRINKFEIIEEIKSHFAALNPSIPANLIAVQQFSEICDHIVSIASEDVISRAEASEQMRRQSRLVYSLKDGPLGHIFHLIKGALLYYFCPMVTELYKYQDAEHSIVLYKKLNHLWVEYLKSMKDYYNDNYDKPCDFDY